MQFFMGYSATPLNLVVAFSAWVISIYLEGSYRLKRFSRLPRVLRDLMRLGLIFLGINLMLQHFLVHSVNDNQFYLTYHLSVLVMLMISRMVALRVIRGYRSLGRNYRNVLILGNTPDTNNLARNFAKNMELGFRLIGTLSKEEFTMTEVKFLVESEFVDEIFVSASEFDSTILNEIIDYAENNLIKIRVVPNFSGVFASHLKLDYVGHQPILVYREVVLDDVVNAALKRTFDVLFSLLVVVFVLSWLIPLLGLLIKRESRGPVLFKQKRSGLHNVDFDCFKFRSMAVNTDSNDVQATKGDMRVTKIGAFIRKTSIDELPQFLNVLIGDMSVVGPRPHMVKHTTEFSSEVDRYMLRHSVKPGITGLAQTRGYRGETKTFHDIKGRVALDRFYIEHWNFFLDITIIFRTFINGAKGDSQAY